MKALESFTRLLEDHLEPQSMKETVWMPWFCDSTLWTLAGLPVSVDDVQSLQTLKCKAKCVLATSGAGNEFALIKNLIIKTSKRTPHNSLWQAVLKGKLFDWKGFDEAVVLSDGARSCCPMNTEYDRLTRMEIQRIGWRFVHFCWPRMMWAGRTLRGTKKDAKAAISNEFQKKHFKL